MATMLHPGAAVALNNHMGNLLGWLRLGWLKIVQTKSTHITLQ